MILIGHVLDQLASVSAESVHCLPPAPRRGRGEIVSRFAAFRVIGNKPGCVDFLGELEAESKDTAEDICRLMYDFDWASGDRLDLELIEDLTR